MMKPFRWIAALIIIILICISAVKIYGQTSKSAPIISQIIIQPETILPGDPVFITIESTSTLDTITWDGKKISIFTYAGKVRAFVPIDFNEKVLEHKVVATLKNNSTLTKNITITPREKIEKPLGIPEKLGGNTPAAADSLIKKLAEENYVLNTIKTATTTLWSEAFAFPLTSIFITDEYGYSRQTVGQSIAHKGTDFRAKIGTEVMAMNDGIVRVARWFDTYGNTVVIDHGLGVQTFYMHMSKLSVKAGDLVKQGQLLGLSGDTGYVDAAHLHISIKINGVSIDPMTFMRFFEVKAETPTKP